MLNSLVNFFTAHIPYWPLVCFSLLILAGFNLPVSEDAVIVLSAGVTLSDSSLVIPSVTPADKTITASSETGRLNPARIRREKHTNGQ